MPFEVVPDATLFTSNACDRQRSSGHLAVLAWSTA
jgi:hypothetical protein